MITRNGAGIPRRDVALTKTQLSKIGKANGLAGTRLKVYSDFFKKRFPQGRDPSYAGEWAERFRKGNQYNLGDRSCRRAMLASARKNHYPINKVKIKYGNTLADWNPTWAKGEKIPFVGKNHKVYYR